MNLNSWLKANKSPEIREDLAKACSTSVRYLSQLANSKSTKKKSSHEMCELLFKATSTLTPDTVIIPADERPDIARVFPVPTEKAAALCQ